MEELNKHSLLNQKEAAELLGVKPIILANWDVTQKYKIPSVKFGWRTLYRLGDLLDLADKIDPNEALGASNDNRFLCMR